MFQDLVELFQLKHRNLVPTLGIFLENDTIPLVVSLHMSCGAVVPWSKTHENPETTARIVSHNSAPVIVVLTLVQASRRG
jgi:hypothetical protein